MSNVNDLDVLVTQLANMSRAFDTVLRFVDERQLKTHEFQDLQAATRSFYSRYAESFTTIRRLQGRK